MPPGRFEARQWSEEELVQLREMVKTKTWAEMAQHFNCHEKTVRAKMHELGLRKTILNKADSAHDLRVSAFSHDHGVRAAANHFDMSIDEVKNSRRRVRERREQVCQEMTREKYEKFRKACYYAAHGKGMYHEKADDFVGWAMVKLLEGRSNPIPKYLIGEYIGELIGKKDSPNSAVRQAMAYAKHITEEYDEDDPGVILAAPEASDFDNRLFAMADALELSVKQRLIFLLHYRDGMGQEELGKYFGFSGGRVSQLLAEVKERLVKNAEAKAILAD